MWAWMNYSGMIVIDELGVI